MSNLAEHTPTPGQGLTDREQLLKSYDGSPLARFLGPRMVAAETTYDDNLAGLDQFPQTD